MDYQGGNYVTLKMPNAPFNLLVAYARGVLVNIDKRKAFINVFLMKGVNMGLYEYIAAFEFDDEE